MSTEPPPLPPQPPKKPIMLPLVLAFVPSVIGLIALMGVTHPWPVAFMVLGAVVSVVCCGTSSVMLFKRNTSGAIVFGILLGLLNLAITAGLGCAAFLSDLNVH